MRPNLRGLAARGRPRRWQSALQNLRGGAFGAPRRRRGRLGLWVLLRFRLALASRALQVHVLFLEPPERKK